MKVTKKAKIGANLTDVACFILGIAGGSFVSGAAYESLLKKAGDSKTSMLAKRVGIAALGIGGATAIDSNDEVSKILKGVGMGMAVRQIFDGAKEAMATTQTATTLITGTKVQKAVAAGIGLACPCDNQTVYQAVPMMRPAKRGFSNRRGMKGPTMAALQSPMSSRLQEAFQRGRALAVA